jgi:hypothetical protein
MSSRNNGSRIFLTELLFSIFFFIVISAVCLQCFAGSYVKSKQAKEMTAAVNLASNAAEEYLAIYNYKGDTIYYDENWHEVDDKNAAYKMTSIVIEPEKKGQCQQMHVVVSTMLDEEIYSLEVEKALK